MASVASVTAHNPILTWDGEFYGERAQYYAKTTGTIGPLDGYSRYYVMISGQEFSYAGD